MIVFLNFLCLSKGYFYYYEFATDDYELISQDKKNFKFNARGESIFDIIKSEIISFPLKPKQRCKKHILFRIFWKNLRLVDSFQVVLEVQLNKNRWKKYGKWIGHLCQQDYDLFIVNNSPIRLGKEFKGNRIIQSWEKYMMKKIDKKYGKDIKMNRIKLPPSKSNW